MTNDGSNFLKHKKKSYNDLPGDSLPLHETVFFDTCSLPDVFFDIDIFFEMKFWIVVVIINDTITTKRENNHSTKSSI